MSKIIVPVKDVFSRHDGGKKIVRPIEKWMESFRQKVFFSDMEKHTLIAGFRVVEERMVELISRGTSVGCRKQTRVRAIF